MLSDVLNAHTNYLIILRDKNQQKYQHIKKICTFKGFLPKPILSIYIQAVFYSHMYAFHNIIIITIHNNLCSLSTFAVFKECVAQVNQHKSHLLTFIMPLVFISNCKLIH